MQNLSLIEREKLKSQHKKERDKRICDRIKAVLLFDEGCSYSQVAHVLLFSDEKEFYFINRAWAWARARKPILQFNYVYLDEVASCKSLNFNVYCLREIWKQT